MGNREDTIERILTAALDLLSDEGFGALGVNTLARKSGADKQLVYRYFGGMDGVLTALGERVALRLTEALAVESASPASYAEMAETLLLCLLRYLRHDPQYRQLRLMEAASPNAASEGFRAARGKAIGTWVAQASAGLAKPEGVDVFALNALLIACVEGIAVLGAVGMAQDAAAEARQDAALSRLVRAAYA